MAKPKPAGASPELGAEQVLYVKTSERSPERVLASFPLNADKLLIDAAKLSEINRAKLAGLDVHALQFRIGREEI